MRKKQMRSYWCCSVAAFSTPVPSFSVGTREGNLEPHHLSSAAAAAAVHWDLGLDSPLVGLAC